MSVESRDNGYAAMLRRLSKAAGGLTVGIHAAEGGAQHEPEAGQKSSGLTIVQIGEIHEFGLGVPRRSFISDWADENEDAHRDQLRAMARALVSGQVDSIPKALDRLGVRAVAEVQKRMADRIPPPLAQSTIDRKGSSVPLIDSGQLRSAITYKVEDEAGNESSE